MRLTKLEVIASNDAEKFFIGLLKRGKPFLFGELIAKFGWGPTTGGSNIVTSTADTQCFDLPQDRKRPANTTKRWLLIPRAYNPEVAFMDDDNVFLKALWRSLCEEQALDAAPAASELDALAKSFREHAYSHSNTRWPSRRHR